MQSIFNLTLSNIVAIVVVAALLIFAIKSTFKKNKKTKCHNCRLKCAHKKNILNKNLQNNSKQNGNNSSDDY